MPYIPQSQKAFYIKSKSCVLQLKCISSYSLLMEDREKSHIFLYIIVLHVLKISVFISSVSVQGTLKTLLQHHSSKASILWCSAFFTVQLSGVQHSNSKFLQIILHLKSLQNIGCISCAVQLILVAYLFYTQLFVLPNPLPPTWLSSLPSLHQ